MSRGRERGLEGVNLLGLAPFRIADWEEDEGRAVVLRPRPTSRGPRGLLDRFFYRMSARRIKLDEVGTFVWNRLDGKRTVRELADGLDAEFGKRVQPVEERLGHLIRLLRQEGLVGYPGWDEKEEGRPRTAGP